MRVGCGSATIGIFAPQWFGQADEVVVVDDHITGVLSEHQAGKFLDMAPSGIRLRGRKSTPGRYFQVANPGSGWGGTDITDPLSIVEGWDAKHGARPGLRMLMVSTTGEDCRLVRARRAARAAAGRDAGGSAARGRADRRELRAVALLGALRRRRGRQPARRGHRQPGAAHPLDQEPAGQRHLRRRAGLRLAGRRHHGDGRRGEDARRQLRLGADAGDRLADRVHDAPRRLPRPRRPHGPGAAARAAARLGRVAHRRRRGRQSLAAGPPGRRSAGERRRPGAARRRPLAFPARADRLHRLRRRRERRRRRVRRSRLAALSRRARRAGRGAAAAAPGPVVARRRRGPARGPGGAAHGRGLSGACDSRPLHHGDGGGGRQRRRGADRRLRRAADPSCLCQQRRRHRSASRAGRVVRGRPLRRPGAWPRRPAARRPLRDRCGLAGARHRHLGLARAQLLARHRRRGDGAGDERIAGRCRRHRHRQCRRRRRSAHRPPPCQRGARRQRPRRSPRHLRRAAAARCLGGAGARQRPPGRRRSEIAAGRIVAALLCLQGRAEACGANPLPQETCP